MKQKLLWTADYSAFWEDKLAHLVDIKRAGFNVHGRSDDYLNEDDLIAELQGCDIFFVAFDKLTRRVLENCPDLKLVLSVRDGPEENIDIAACRDMGIPVLNSGGRSTVSVAEFTFALLLNMARPIITLNNAIHRDRWTQDNRPALRKVIVEQSTELYARTLGIIGFGRNGRRLAKYALAFGMKVVVHDPYLTQQNVAAEGVELLGLDELMAASDYVSVLARATADNHHLIGREQFARMKPSAGFVNTGRASLVDTAALKEALASDRIRMAAVDVFETEPLGPDDSYYDIAPEKLILTNHAAGYSQDRATHMYANCLDVLVKYLDGSAIQNNCTRGVEDTPAYQARGAKLFGRNAGS